MLENLRTFVFREAGDSGVDRQALLRFLAPSLHIADGYDFNGLSELSRNAYGHHFAGGHNEEYVASPGGCASDLLRCIAVRPYNRNGYEDTPYVLVEQAARHLRDVLNDAADPDYDGTLRHAYIEREHLPAWTAAAQRWRQSRTVVVAPAGPRLKPVQRSQAQNEAILSMLRSMGYDPAALPKRESGKAGVKAEVRHALGDGGMWVGTQVFNKAWARLRDAGEISEPK